MRKKAIGIDLGTTNSVMAVVREDVPEIIPMGTNDDQVLRSAVYFSYSPTYQYPADLCHEPQPR